MSKNTDARIALQAIVDEHGAEEALMTFMAQVRAAYQVFTGELVSRERAEELIRNAVEKMLHY